MGYRPTWGGYRPKIVLDMVNQPNAPLKEIIETVFWSVVNAMDSLIEEDLHFDSTMLGEPFSFTLIDSDGNKQDVMDEVLEEMTDNYEGLYEVVLDAITWKQRDNEKDWMCRCGKHIPNWVETKKDNESMKEVEVVDHTQRKIDAYFKPLQRDGEK